MKKSILSILLLIMALFTLTAQRAVADTADSDAVSTLTAAKDSLEAFYNLIGEGLGYYSVTSETIDADSIKALISKVETLVAEEEPDSAEVADATAEVAATEGIFSINMPTAGMFLRIKSHSTGAYLSSTLYADGQSAVTTDGTGMETIFYYDGNTLLSYATGYYVQVSSSNYLYFDGIITDTLALTIEEYVTTNSSYGGVHGCYYISYLNSSSTSYMLSIGNSTNVVSLSYRTYGGDWLGMVLEEVELDDDVLVNSMLVDSVKDTNGAIWGTIYSPVEVAVPSGATPYVVSVDEDGEFVWTQINISTIPANSGVVLCYSSTASSAAAASTDDDGTEFEYMSGQVATATATGSECVLSLDDDGNVTFTSVSAGTELAGFTAYVTVESSYTADDVQTALDQFTSTYTIGTTLGTYSVTIDEVTVGETTYTDYATLAAAAEELISSEDASASDYEEMVTALNSAYSSASYTLNLPEAGDFIRIKNYTSDYYLYSTNSTGVDATYGSAALVTSKEGDYEAGTIMYYDGIYLINYETGYYLAVQANNRVYYNDVTDGTQVTFEENTGGSGVGSGEYAVVFLAADGSTKRNLFFTLASCATNASSYQANRGSNHVFVLEEVESLPVTTDEAGYATLYSPQAVEVPSGVTFYSLSFDEDGNETKTALETTPSILAAEQPVILKGEASTTYSFTLSDEEGTEVDCGDDVGGVVATVYASSITGAVGVLTYDEDESTSSFVKTSDEVPGFQAYASLPEPDWDGLKTAIDNLDAYSDVIGDGLGEYNVGDYDTDAVAATLALAEALYEEQNDTTTITTVDLYIDSLTNYYNAVSINLPEAGTFLRIKSQAGDYYLSSNISSSNSARAAFVTSTEDDNEAATIFYFDGTQLLAYGTGYYIVNNSNHMGYNGVQTSGMTMAFCAATDGTTSKYNVVLSAISDTRFLYCNYSSLQTDAGNFSSTGIASDSYYRYNYELSYVDELPVVLNDAGLAVVSAPVNLTVPEEVTAVYTLAWGSVTVDEETAVTVDSTLVEGVEVIPADTAVLIKGEAGDTVRLAITTDGASDIGDNALTATLATISGDATYYVLTYANGYPQFVETSDDEVLGFGGYLTAEDGEDAYYFTADYETATAVPDWDGLADAIELLSTLGEGLGEYSVTTDYTYSQVKATLALAQALYDEQSDTTTIETVDLYIDSLTTYYGDGLTLNLPATGTFLRFRAAASSYDSYYVSSTNENSSTAIDVTSDGTGASTIFYYTTDSMLINYETGYYITVNSTSSSPKAIYNGILSEGTDFLFSDSGEEGLYFIRFCSDFSSTYTRYWYCATTSVTNQGTLSSAPSYSSSPGYFWHVEEVESLPVTLNAAGYATFYTPVAAEIPDGATVSTVTVNDGAITTTALSGTLPAGSAVLVSGTAETEYDFTISSSSDEASNGSLTGQLATALSTGSYDYTLQAIDKDEFFSGADTLQGFTAYMTIPSGLNAYALATTDYVTEVDSVETGTVYYVRTTDGYAYATEDGLSYTESVDGDSYKFALVSPKNAASDETTLLYNVGQNAYFDVQLEPGNNAIVPCTLADANEAPELYPFKLSTDSASVTGFVLQETTSATIPAVYEVTVGSLGLSTLALPVTTLVPDSITAVYIATETTDTTVILSDVLDADASNSLPAVGEGREVGDDSGKGVIIAATASLTLYFPNIVSDATTISVSGNLLNGVTEASTLSKGSGYLLISDDGKPKFRVSGGVKVPAYKAYLNKQYSSTSTLSVSFGSSDIVSGIGAVDAATAGEQGVYYDLQGRRVLNPTKGGIYIIDGKKVIK